MALATLEVARSRGRELPRDLSLISFDNTPIVRFTQPPLTAVDQPIAETVSRAVELIIAQQHGKPPADAPTDIGRAHVLTPVTNSHFVCLLLLDKHNYINNNKQA